MFRDLELRILHDTSCEWEAKHSILQFPYTVQCLEIGHELIHYSPSDGTQPKHLINRKHTTCRQPFEPSPRQAYRNRVVTNLLPRSGSHDEVTTHILRMWQRSGRGFSHLGRGGCGRQRMQYKACICRPCAQQWTKHPTPRFRVVIIWSQVSG